MTRFTRFSLQSFAAAAAVAGLAWLAPLTADARSACLLGAALSGVCGALALLLKHRAVSQPGLTSAMRAIVITFALRALLVAQGVFVTARLGAPLYFVAAFFAVYAAQQAIESSWVMHPEGAT